jgi:hypothetical protein
VISTGRWTGRDIGGTGGWALRGDEIAGSRLRHDHLLLFKRLIGLLDGADADAVLLAQAAHRRQLFAVAIQALFDAFGQQRGQMLVAGHAVSLIVAIQME